MLTRGQLDGLVRRCVPGGDLVSLICEHQGLVLLTQGHLERKRAAKAEYERQLKLLDHEYAEKCQKRCSHPEVEVAREDHEDGPERRCTLCDFRW